MSVYVAVHTSKSPSLADLASVAEVARLLGAPEDTSPAPLDWREGEVTLVISPEALRRLLESLL